MSLLTQSQMLEKILHSDHLVRDRALLYFNSGCSRDRRVLPTIIQAIEKYGRHTALAFLENSKNLLHTAETVDWMIAELNDEDLHEACDHRCYANLLVTSLMRADHTLLAPRLEAIQTAKQFDREQSFLPFEVLHLQQLDFEESWEALEEFCENCEENGPDEDYCSAAIGAIHLQNLMRFGSQCESKIADCFNEFEEGELTSVCLQAYVIFLAGRLRLESLIPKMIEGLHDQDSVILDACEEALVRIGTPVVLAGIAKEFSASNPDFQNAATNVLECIYTGECEAACLDMSSEEAEVDTRIFLAMALLSIHSTAGLEPARQLILDAPSEYQVEGLLEELVDFCTLSGERFPEYEEWLEVVTVQRENRDDDDEDEPYEDDDQSYGDEFEEESNELKVMWAMQQLQIRHGAFVDSLAELSRQTAAPIETFATPVLPSKIRVGRNDPCPCGSGRKYKKCCEQLE